MDETGKMTEEARKEIFGKSEEETAPEDKDHNRQYSGPGPTGHRHGATSDKGS